MTSLDDREEPLGDRMKLLEVVVAHLADRTADIENLAIATDRLSESTAGLDVALREVGKVKTRQDKLEHAVEDVARDVPQVAALVPRRWFWASLVLLAVVVAAAVLSMLDRQHIHREVRNNHRIICQLQTELGNSC